VRGHSLKVNGNDHWGSVVCAPQVCSTADETSRGKFTRTASPRVFIVSQYWYQKDTVYFSTDGLVLMPVHCRHKWLWRPISCDHRHLVAVCCQPSLSSCQTVNNFNSLLSFTHNSVLEVHTLLLYVSFTLCFCTPSVVCMYVILQNCKNACHYYQTVVAKGHLL